MGTKNNPGKYDCYVKAEPDEPMFILLARDIDAPMLVSLWIKLKYRDGGVDQEKIIEAIDCARAMEEWRDKKEFSDA